VSNAIITAAFCQQFHFTFTSLFPEFLPLKRSIPLRQVEFSERIADILLHRQKVFFCGDKVELHFVVLEEQKHNTELRKLDTEWLLKAPCPPGSALL
jgi:hypothetical protein